MPTRREGPQARCPRGPVSPFYSVGKIAFDVWPRGSGRSAILPPLRRPTLEDIMTTQSHISRRHMLALSTAAGGAAASGLGAALAQQRPRLPAEIVLTPRIDRFDPALDKIIATSEPIRGIAGGFRGPPRPARGPLWWEEGGHRP